MSEKISVRRMVYRAAQVLSAIVIVLFSTYGIALEMPGFLTNLIVSYGFLGNVAGLLVTCALIAAYTIVVATIADALLGESS